MFISEHHITGRYSGAQAPAVGRSVDTGAPIPVGKPRPGTSAPLRHRRGAGPVDRAVGTAGTTRGRGPGAPVRPRPARGQLREADGTFGRWAVTTRAQDRSPGMKHTTRTAAALAAATVALVTAYGTAHAACHTLAPGQQRATVASPADEHDPKEDVEVAENGLPDLDED
ncbi:hypothetical protein GCM10010521_34470 [Streptomyces rameus]|uniref:CAP domain-containing protein n=2 Tax=Streptomyces TaxID=1883 RepID=A0ABP6NDR1_9ACTN